jgi:sugar phosphate permease
MAVGLAFFVGNSQRAATSGKRVLLREGLSSLGNSGIARAIVASSLLVASIDIFVTFAPALGIERSISVTVIVALLVVRAVTTMLARALLGGLVSTFGRREVLVGSGILSAVSLAFFAFPLPIGGLVAVAAVYGFAIGVGQPITMAWVYLLAPDHSRGLALSMRLAGNRVGQMAVPLVVGSLAAGVGTPAVFGITALGVCVASWVSVAVPRQDGQPTDEATY